MTDRHDAALRAALAEYHWLTKPGNPAVTPDYLVARIVEAALTAADEHDAQQTVLCGDGRPVHDFKGQPICPGCGWGGIQEATSRARRTRMMTKTQVVLELQDDGYGKEDSRVYTDPSGGETSLEVEAEKYWDMGEPLHVTVTIEPGDKLQR